MNFPRAVADQLAWLSGAKFSLIGTLDTDELFELNSLVQCVENRGDQTTPAANDAGTEISYAVRYGKDGAESVLLGASGDDMFENTDASAQALYRLLRERFPKVTSYFGSPRMAPAGFAETPLMTFCGFEGVSLAGLKATKTEIDCEEYREPVALTDAEAAALAEKLGSMRVTGRQNCVVTTGGSIVYAFLDENGSDVARFEFYGKLLVMPDGMYTVE